MSRYVSGILILICIAAVIAGTIWSSRAKITAPGHPLSRPQKTDLIETAYPRVRDFKELKPWIGTAQAKTRIRVLALSDGTITYVTKRDEQQVKKGELLFAIGGYPVSARLASLKTKINALRQQLTLATKTLNLKRRAVKEGLARTDELTAAQESLITAKADLKSAQAELSALRKSLSIRSPIAGIFTNRRVTVGQRVSKGTELAQILGLHGIRVIAKVFTASPESLVGKRTMVHTQDGRQLAGTIMKALPNYDPSGAALLWIEGPQLDGNLRPGERVDGLIQVAVHKSALCVPRSALVYDAGEHPHVFVKRPTGYEKRAVRTGLSSGGWIEVISGLRKQDEIVIRGGYELFYREFKKIYKVAD